MSTIRKKQRAAAPKEAEPGRVNTRERFVGNLPGLLYSSIVAMICMLFVWRLVVPTESAPEGDTLWIAQLWPLALMLWGLQSFRAGELRLRWSWVDAALWAMVAGQVIAAACVLRGSGDKRTALNMIWEWLGLGLTFFLMRQIFLTRRDFRGPLLVLNTVTIAIALLGIWQHDFGYNEMVREINRMIAKRDELKRTGPPLDLKAAAEWKEELKKVEYELYQIEYPSDSDAQAAWERRIRFSNEPLGTFALANSFAGLLLVSLMIFLGTLWEALRRRDSIWNIIVGAIAAGIVAYCLVLTKSRTSYLAGLIALGLWGLCQIRVQMRRPKRFLSWVGGGAIVIALLGYAAWEARGLDLQVLTEAPKSLRYRLEYWATTWRVITESPRNALIGVGPGNFRQHYLKYKLPESSEEIADPHNMVLDVWVNGGLLGLTGLLTMLAMGCAPLARCLIKGRSREAIEAAAPGASHGSLEQKSVLDHTQIPAANLPEAVPVLTQQDVAPQRTKAVEPEINGKVELTPLLIGGTLGFLLAWVTGGFDVRLLALWMAWLGLMFVCKSFFSSSEISLEAGGVAIVAMGIHLLGAGGIAMPAICQLLLLLVAYCSVGQSDAVELQEYYSPAAKVLPVIVGLGLSLGCYFTATTPVFTRQEYINAGDAFLYQRGNADRAEDEYHRAARADDLSAIPLEKLARMAFQLWEHSHGKREDEFQRGVKIQQQVIALDPAQSGGYRALGKWYLEKAHVSEKRKDAAEAVNYLKDAVLRYPNHAGLLSELTEALWLAGRSDEAVASARRTLELDEIIHRVDHPDKWLHADRLRLMKKIAGESNDPAN